MSTGSEYEFWHERWETGKIGFHQTEVHPALVAHEGAFLGQQPRRVLVPLCGKSVDLVWLAERDHEVVGVELVRKAVVELFAEHGVEPEVDRIGPYERFRAHNLTVLCGDVFELAPEHAGRFDRVWDRAALVALGENRRGDYVQALLGVGGDSCNVLLSAFEYDQAAMTGPPFSVPEDEVRRHYAGHHIEVLERRDAGDEVPFPGHDYFRVVTYLIGS